MIKPYLTVKYWKKEEIIRKEGRSYPSYDWIVNGSLSVSKNLIFFRDKVTLDLSSFKDVAALLLSQVKLAGCGF